MTRLKMIQVGVLGGALMIGGVASARYLQPEPLLAPHSAPMSVAQLNAPLTVRRMFTIGGPAFIASRAQAGLSTPVYSYATNNPISRFDPNGLYDYAGYCKATKKGAEPRYISRHYPGRDACFDCDRLSDDTNPSNVTSPQCKDTMKSFKAEACAKCYEQIMEDSSPAPIPDSASVLVCR